MSDFDKFGKSLACFQRTIEIINLISSAAYFRKYSTLWSIFDISVLIIEVIVYQCTYWGVSNELFEVHFYH